jgi:hypothetical protein
MDFLTSRISKISPRVLGGGKEEKTKNFIYEHNFATRDSSQQ